MLYKCKSCGGNVVYDPERKKMYCPHCENEDNEELIKGTTMQQCPNCGAPMEVQDCTSATKCKHCESYVIFEERIAGEYEPHLLLPFQIGKEKVKEILRNEFGKRIFTPGSFLSEASLEKMEGNYVPFWLYDFDANYDFQGTGTKVRVWTTGDTEYTETSFYSIERNMDIQFARIPADASKKMEDGIMDLLEPYQYQELGKFEPKFLSGFHGEVYDQGADEMEGRAKNKATSDAETLLQGTINGYSTVSQNHKELKMSRKETNYALLPVWIYTYQFQGKDYVFYVNGQTGKVIGETPVSFGKVLQYGSTVCGLGILMMWILKLILEVL